MARSIRVASSLDQMDALLASLAGKGEPDRSLIIRCDKIEVVHGNRGSAPEMECFGDVMVTDSTLSIQAERVQKRGKTLVFEGSSGKPVQIIEKSGDKAVSRITATEVTRGSSLESSVLLWRRGCPAKDIRDYCQPQVDCFFPLFRPRPSLEDEGFRFALPVIRARLSPLSE